MEILDLVDDNGSPTGVTASREEAHRLGLQHRTSHVWLVRKREGTLQLLLQKRSRDKDSYPGCWDISSAGHIPAGQGFQDSAVRELREELGVAAKPEELLFCGLRRFTFSDTFHGKPFRDRQVSAVYALLRPEEESTFVLQQSELESVRWTDFPDCVELAWRHSKPNCLQLEELNMVLSGIREHPSFFHGEEI